VPPRWSTEPALRLVETPHVRVADVALFYGERSGGIRTYLDAKRAYAEQSGAFEQHLVVPGRRERHAGTRHELRALSVASSNGYRLPLRTAPLERTLRAIEPDVIVVHDPFWALVAAARVGEELDVPVVAAHHGSSHLDAAGLPGPTGLYRRMFQAWFRVAYERVDAVMSAVDTAPDSGRAASIPLRFGLDPAFRPGPVAERGDEVLYAGRFGREKGVVELLEAAAMSEEPWPLRLVGSGPAQTLLEHRAQRLGIGERVRFEPFVADRTELARRYASARCVVMPGAFETFGLVALEAAASGAAVVACETAPSAAAAAGLVDTFRAHDAEDLSRAIAAARARIPDPAQAERLASGFSWEHAFERELEDLDRLLR
jgi:glycosyltransferase involved in cell wall biosynthesis